MSAPETFALDPGQGSDIFITAGMLRTAEDLQNFFVIEEPELQPTLTLGSFTKLDYIGNPGVTEQYVSEIDAFLNAKGLPNGGELAMRELRASIRDLKSIGYRVILSVTNLPKENGLETIPELVEAAAELEPTAIEANLSCPNGVNEKTGELHPPICNNPEQSFEIVSAVRKRIGRNVVFGVKDSSHTTDPGTPVSKEAVISLWTPLRTHVDFAVGINTIGGMPAPDITATGGKGGMSGPIVAPVARQWLEAVHNTAPEIPILSCGGIESKNIAEEAAFRRAHGALLIGGAQQFWRSANMAMVAVEWARRAA